MLMAGVIGYPISHSLSPVIHGYWLKHYGIKGRYEAIEVKPEELGRELLKLRRDGFSGVNVTLPHKEAVLAWVRSQENGEVSDEAALAGAANTILFRHRTIRALNTDIYGISEHLKPAVKARGKAVMIGAGGAARGVAVALLNHLGFARVVIANRTMERAAHLVTDLGRACASGQTLSAVAWESLATEMRDADMLINCTTLGMKGQPELQISLETLAANAVVCDIVYTPLETALLKAAKAKGHHAVGGLGMLLHQAVPGFEAWFGVKPEVTPELEQTVLAALATRG